MSKRFSKRIRKNHSESESILKSVQDKFSIFLRLLDRNNHVLEVMGDMEEKAQGEYLFDINYIRNCLSDIRFSVKEIISDMVALGGPRYEILRDRFSEIDAVVESVIPGQQPVKEDEFTVPFDRLNRTRALSVGSKNAQLGEMKTILKMPVPEGFAITASAYKHYVAANDLQRRITKRIEAVDIKSYDELVRISNEICNMIVSSPVPENLSEEIMLRHRQLVERAATDKFSMRSSAIGEDTLFSFAGQYASYLNVCPDELIDRYREILSSKFTPKAIYYFLSHSLSEAELAMSVGCTSMIDAASSGVVYTRDPVNPLEEVVLIHSIYGLGKYLVNGTLTPDVFRVSRDGYGVIASEIANKPIRLIMHPVRGTLEEVVPEDKQDEPSLSQNHIRQLAEYAVRLEKHYRGPQDIEWAVDQTGRLFLLQSRPLQVFKSRAESSLPDLTRYKVVASGGTTVCPGAGSGPIYHIVSHRDLPGVPDGAVLVAPSPFPGMITVIGKINALVTRVGGLASHMATIAREYRVPTLVGMENAPNLPQGQIVTVDANGRTIYEGDITELIKAREPEFESPEASSIYRALDKVLDLVSPLRLLHPTDDDFLPENCVTYHDITRYAHQMAMEEMFTSAREMEEKSPLGCRLKSEFPVNMNVIFIDRECPQPNGKDYVTEDDLQSLPMEALWTGIKEEGWPAQPRLVKPVRVMGTAMTARHRSDYSQSSFAILSRQYMILSLRMGYHFTTVEAMCTDETDKNYIQMQYKEGGASLDRRIRRIKLLTDILSRLGFVQQHKGDYLNTIFTYQEKSVICEKLRLLGRLLMMTKQLDMALSNDAVAQWYTEDIVKRLGLIGADGPTASNSNEESV